MAAAAIPVVAAWMGSGAVATFAASVVVYAAIGAVVGGLSAAVMGGDIGKGILFGAIGGAVMGGVSGAIANLGTAAGTTTGSAGGALQKAAVTTAIDSGGRGAQILSTGVGASSGTGAGAAAGGMLKDLAPTLAQGAIGVAGSVIEGKAQSKESEKNRQFEMEKLDKLHQQNLETIAAQSRGGGGGGGGGAGDQLEIAKLNAQLKREELDEQRRQYNVARGDAMDKVETRKSALLGMRASRSRGKLKPGAAPGIDRQGNKDIPGLFADDPAQETAVAQTLTPEEQEVQNAIAA